MSDQLSNTGISGLLGMSNSGPVMSGQPASIAGASASPFGSIMQAQAAGFPPTPLDVNGQPLPQTGELLPPSGEMLAQMQAQLEVRERAPELSQLVVDAPEFDLLGPVLEDTESLREGVVVKDQWLGLAPPSDEFKIDTPDVVTLMQEVMSRQADNQTASVLSGSLSESETSNVQSELLYPDANMSIVPSPVEAGEGADKLITHNTMISSELSKPTIMESELDPLGERVDLGVNTQVPISSDMQSAVAISSGVNVQLSAQNTVAVMPVMAADSQAVRNATASRAPAVSVNTLTAEVSGSITHKDAAGATGQVTQLVSPATQAPASLPSGTDMSGQSAVTTLESKLVVTEGGELSRTERGGTDVAQGSSDKSEGWLRAEGRGILSPSISATGAADQAAKMTPSQTAFTLAGNGQMGSAPWGNALSERIMVMTAQNNQVAEIQLDPPELGSLKIRLQVGQDQVSVSFTSPHASVRDAVEQSMPRLREMLEEQGLSLGESSVNDQSSDADSDGRQGRFASDSGDEHSGSSDEHVSAAINGDGLSLVDYYA